MKHVPLFFVQLKFKDNVFRDEEYGYGAYYQTIAYAQQLKARRPKLHVSVEPMYVYEEIEEEDFLKKYLPYELDKIWGKEGEGWISLQEHSRRRLK
jgi:hypothetical protein